jgi:hypothetical protein
MADHHDAGKPVTISGHVGELLAVFQNDDDLVAALRRRMEYIGASYGLVEHLADPPMAEGALAKYLSPLRVKGLTVASLLRIGHVLGLRAALIVDESLTRKMQGQRTKRDAAKARAKRLPSIGQAQLRRVLKPVARELGRKGGLARQAMLSPEQRRAIGRRGAAIRWARRSETSSRP